MPEAPTPRSLQNIIDTTLEAQGATRAPAATPCHTQVEVIETRRRRETECLLRTVLHKLSPYDDARRDEHNRQATDEMTALRRLLLANP